MGELEKKKAAYNELVEKINSYDPKALEKMKLVACKDCKEVNLWSYWEGGRSHLDADILMVGQDWGSIDYDDEPISVAIKNPSMLQDFCYMKNNSNPTDNSICTLLKEVYSEIDFDKDCNTQTQIFFTNFVPWYREPGAKISGGYKKLWTENSTELFAELVSIIRPKIIMCLGHDTYDGVCDSLGLNRDKTPIFSEIVENGCREVTVGSDTIQVFPLFHPGTKSRINRLFEKQVEDWKKVKEQLDKVKK